MSLDLIYVHCCILPLGKTRIQILTKGIERNTYTQRRNTQGIWEILVEGLLCQKVPLAHYRIGGNLGVTREAADATSVAAGKNHPLKLQ